MNTIELTNKDFETTVGKAGIVLVDFWASWCGPCRAFAPVFERTAAKHADITFAKVNTEEEQHLASTLNISAIPTLMVFRDGVPLFSQAGALPESALEKLIQQVRELDMVEVRRKYDQAMSKQRPVAARAGVGS